MCEGGEEGELRRERSYSLGVGRPTDAPAVLPCRLAVTRELLLSGHPLCDWTTTGRELQII